MRILISKTMIINCKTCVFWKRTATALRTAKITQKHNACHEKGTFKRKRKTWYTLHNENQITCTCINRDCIRFCLDYNDLTKDINVCPNALLDIDKVLTTVILQYGNHSTFFCYTSYITWQQVNEKIWIHEAG